MNIKVVRHLDAPDQLCLHKFRGIVSENLSTDKHRHAMMSQWSYQLVLEIFTSRR